MNEHEGSGYPVTTGEAILALRKFAKSATDYEKLILTWVADHLERETQCGDLISRSALLEEFGEEPLVWDGRDREQVQECNDWEWYTGLVKAAPAVDAVIPVRCRDCKHGRKSDHAYAVDTAKPLGMSIVAGENGGLTMNLCDTCIHRKVCCCEDPTMPTEDCRYYDQIPKHGRWIIGLDGSCMCSECSTVFRYEIGKYCSNCGSMMLGDANDEG